MKKLIFVGAMVLSATLIPSLGNRAHAAETLTVASTSVAIENTEKIITEGFLTPKTLKKGEQGAWIIKIDPKSISGQLTGAADYGDAQRSAPKKDPIFTPTPLYLGTHVVFLHTYKKTGKYQQVFNLKDSQGRMFRLVASLRVVR